MKRAQCLPANGEERALTQCRGDRRGLVMVIDPVPRVGAWCRRPARPFQPEQWDPVGRARRSRVATHALGERVRGVDDGLDALLSKIRTQARDTPEAANLHRADRQPRLRHSASE